MESVNKPRGRRSPTRPPDHVPFEDARLSLDSTAESFFDDLMQEVVPRARRGIHIEREEGHAWWRRFGQNDAAHPRAGAVRFVVRSAVPVGRGARKEQPAVYRTCYQRIVEMPDPCLPGYTYQLRLLLEGVRGKLLTDLVTDGVILSCGEALRRDDIPSEAPPRLKFYHWRASRLPLSVAARARIHEELSRLEALVAGSTEYESRLRYVKLVFDLPWGKVSPDLRDARRRLDRSHSGREAVKARALEHLAGARLNPRARCPFLCLVGERGVGKTSLARDMAEAMGRKFETVSLVGLSSPDELRGVRRGAGIGWPGGIMQAIRRAGTRNPVILLDDVDCAEPSAMPALLELLDPTAHHAFRDAYLDFPWDLSPVFFILTATSRHDVPGVLLDRLDVLEVPSLGEGEKVEIARKHLVPTILEAFGQPPRSVAISEDALRYAIRWHTGEAGVLELDHILRRVVRRLILQNDGSWPKQTVVSVKRIARLLGPAIHQPQRRTPASVGAVPTLACTHAGGGISYVEALFTPGEHHLTLTGGLGQAMQESAQAAWSYVRDRLRLGCASGSHRPTSAHVHVSDESESKDGPSSGLAMVAALASLITNLPPSDDVAITGEISLTGRVLPVGGIREKLIAACAEGFARVVMPAANARELEELPREERARLDVVLVERIDQALEAAIPGIATILSDE